MSNISKIKIKNADGTEKEYNISDDDIGAKIGNLEDLTTEDKSNLVNAINEVASKGGGVNMTVTTLYDGSYSGNTFTESVGNYDIVVVCGKGLYYTNRDYIYILPSPIMFFPKLSLTYYPTSFSEIGYGDSDNSLSINLSVTTYCRLNAKSFSIAGTYNPDRGTITVYGIKLGG